MQEQEVGDGTNFIIILAGALLHEAEDMLRMVIETLFFSFSSLSLMLIIPFSYPSLSIKLRHLESSELTVCETVY